MKRGQLLAIMVALGASLILCDLTMAQPGRGRGGWGNMFDNSLATLMRSDVRDELGLAEEQTEQLEELQRTSRDTMREMFQRGRENGQGVDWEAMREEIQDKMKDLEGQVNDILLPHQIERLEQIVLQGRQRRGTTSALESVASKLNISDEQMEKLKAKAEEAQKEYEEKLAEARKEMQDQILSVLDSDQRAKYKELVGDTFEYSNNRRRRDDGGDRENNRRRNRDDF